MDIFLFLIVLNLFFLKNLCLKKIDFDVFKFFSIILHFFYFFIFFKK